MNIIIKFFCVFCSTEQQVELVDKIQDDVDLEGSVLPCSVCHPDEHTKARALLDSE